MQSQNVDILIVGGGSAGCVLAARLSADPGTRVMLLEAGPDLPPSAAPGAIRSAYPGRAYFNPAWLWPGLRVTMGDAGSNSPAQPRPYEQARILGGGSSINGLGTNRGAPADYDGWAEQGATGWAWADVLPFFRKIETDHDFDGPLHGKDGPLPIRHVRRADWPLFAKALADTLGTMGFAQRDDQNGAWEDGVFPTAVNLSDTGRRVGAAMAYLTPEVRRRPNLRILTGALVQRLTVEGGRVRAVEAVQEGVRLALQARTVILSAGAIATPGLLMRSGIGPAAHLRERGIDLRMALPGVGENLQEHPSIGVSGFLAPSARMPPGEGYHLSGLLRWSSGLDQEAAGDMHTSFMARSGWHAVGRRVGSLFTWVNRSYSRGRVRLAEEPGAPPHVDFRMLSDPRDLARLMQGFRLAVRVLSAEAMACVVSDIFPSTYSARVRGLLRPSWRNGVIMGLAGPLMDVSPAVRRRMLAGAVEGEADIWTLAADDALLETHLRRHVGGVWHACGTCRMGRAGDPMSVTDPEARVRGLDGLIVCDGSLMPRIPAANINLPILMMAEKIADTIRRGAR